MKGYIYPMYAGADPDAGWLMNDPIFGRAPTIGACVPNIRRAVEIGDYIFCISGRVEGVKPYVVGRLRVKEKIDALAAYHRFPENRLSKSVSGQNLGNVIVTGEGKQHPLDRHSSFERRVENYIIGDSPIFLDDSEAIARAREETLPFLSDLFEKQGNRVFDIVGRWRKLDEDQVKRLNNWLSNFNE